MVGPASAQEAGTAPPLVRPFALSESDATAGPLSPPPGFNVPLQLAPAIVGPLPPFTLENIRYVQVDCDQSILHAYYSATERVKKSKDVQFPDGTTRTVRYEILQPIGETKTVSVPLGQVDIFDRSGQKVDVSKIKSRLANRTLVFVIVGAEAQYRLNETIAGLFDPSTLVVRINAKPEDVRPMVEQLGFKHDSHR